MKKTISLLSAIFIVTLGFAQAPLNKTVYDCDGNKKNIHDVLGTGKAIIIAHKGVDCSICKSSAAPLQTWAKNNTKTVEVWGAMTYKYNPNTFKPECQATKDWDSTYVWDDIFAFADSNRDWHNNSTPRYYVYSAIDSTIVFEGSSRTVAQDSALKHTKVVVGIQNQFDIDKVRFSYNPNSLTINNLPKEVSQIDLLDISGRILIQESLTNDRLELSISHFPRGIYFIRLKSDQNELATKKLMFY